MPDATFDMAWTVVRQHEGGYVNDPHDAGGETNFGISARQYPSEDIKGMTEERAKLIYFTDYWLRYRIGQLPGLALPVKVMDMAVLMARHGRGIEAVYLLQMALAALGRHVAADGVIGPQTVQACRSVPEDALLGHYRALLMAHLDAIADANPRDERFRRGWEARAVA